MWICKKCGNKLSDEWQECWKCNTGREWVPRSDWVTPPDAPVFPLNSRLLNQRLFHVTLPVL